MAGLDVFIVNIAFPQIHTDFPGTSLGWLSWVLNSYTIVFAAFLIAAGRWSDTFGRKRSYCSARVVVRAGLGRLRAGARRFPSSSRRARFRALAPRC